MNKLSTLEVALKLLCSSSGCSTDKASINTCFGLTPMMLAERNGQSGLTEVLLAHGAQSRY